MPWIEISQAFYDIGYNGHVVMAPFVMMGGQVKKEIKVWRDISKGATEKNWIQMLQNLEIIGRNGGN